MVKKQLQENLDYEKARLKHNEYVLESMKNTVEQQEYHVNEIKRFIKELEESLEKLNHD